MNNNPRPITDSELTELWESFAELRDSFGAATPDELRDFYIAVFDGYMTTTPGYFGTLFMFIGDLPESPMAILKKGENKFHLIAP